MHETCGRNVYARRESESNRRRPLDDLSVGKGSPGQKNGRTARRQLLDAAVAFQGSQFQELPGVPRRIPEGLRVRAHLSSGDRSEEHTSELQSLMRISYAVFCLK